MGIGVKENTKVAREMITKLFESIRVKIYDKKDVDQQMIYWSKNIKSDLIIPVLQKIMDNENIFTIWEKTAMFSGYFKILYFTHESFMVSEAKIAEILNNEIDYVENLTMSNEKTKQFLNNIDQFIFHRQNPELAIIRCTYPYKLDIKISLFGRQNLVHKAKKRLQTIINKNTMRIVQLRIPLYQQEYLLENSIEQLKDIEDEHKDDCVKIRIRETEFSAPQYLIDKIHEKIKQLMIQPVIFQYKGIGNSVQLTDDDIKKVHHIAEYNYCRIEKIESKVEMKVYSIPKASSQLTNISSSIIQQSNEFISSLSMRKISVLNGSIEIYLTDQTRTIPRDVTIISSPQDAIEEGIEYKNEYGYFEMKTGKKFLFHRWSPTVADGDKTNKKLKSSIHTFISSTLQNITTCCTSARKIVFLTNQWKHVGSQSQQQSLAHNLINEIKQEIEARKINWSILFIFNKEKIDLYKEFHQILVQYQTDQDGFAQFCSTVSTVQISVLTLSNLDLIKCEHEINNYVEKHFVIKRTITDELNIRQWDQHMINVFYKYCLNKSVLPMIDLMTNSQIHLIGSMLNVKKVMEKCKLMSEIFKEKLSLQTQAASTSRTLFTKIKHPSQINVKGYNIYFSYCQYDQTICNRITTYLINEGYSLCETSLTTTKFQSDIDKSDVILIPFSENYSKNKHSTDELNYAKSKGKILIPFVMRNTLEENSWLSSLTIAELFYDAFNSEIDIEFKDDFDFEYDKLLSRLLRHTKPGITGKIYSETATLPKISQTNEEYSNTNDAGFVTDQLSNDASLEHDSMSFNHSVSEAYFSSFNSNPGSCFNNEESSNYFYRLIRSTRPINHMQTIMEDNDTAWDTVSLLQAHINPDEDEIDDEWKTPEEIRKLEELDNPNRVWKNTRNAEKFIQQKLKNILEFKELCEKSS
ncbi:unnamed protein product [Rotaria sordida]|uniref:TIR domain-containing protein n=2 Tax=Rotaria sordida TaxID=392033 RepID=A0A814TAH1_9BILA|nr:unnamed protein product [Rotaria sordida]